MEEIKEKECYTDNPMNEHFQLVFIILEVVRL